MTGFAFRAAPSTAEGFGFSAVRATLGFINAGDRNGGGFAAAEVRDAGGFAVAFGWTLAAGRVRPLAAGFVAGTRGRAFAFGSSAFLRPRRWILPSTDPRVKPLPRASAISVAVAPWRHIVFTFRISASDQAAIPVYSYNAHSRPDRSLRQKKATLWMSLVHPDGKVTCGGRASARRCRPAEAASAGCGRSQPRGHEANN